MVDNQTATIYGSMLIGSAVGCVGATVATVWGGYEIGSSLNDALHITNSMGRGALDLLMMGLVALPAHYAGFRGGMVCGHHIGGYLVRADERKKISRYRMYQGIPDETKGCRDMIVAQWKKITKK